MKKDILIFPKATIKEALKKLNITAEKNLLVVDENEKLLGTLTDGDIRRHILKTGSLEGSIKEIYGKTPIFIYENEYEDEKAREILIKNAIEIIPVVNDADIVVGYKTWLELFGEKIREKTFKKIDTFVVIMAGGKGKRLEPFTQVLPKPLIPVGDKTIVEHIIDRFGLFGVKKFYMIINFKGEMIEAYFKGIKKDYQIDFMKEKEFLGTAGSLKLLENLDYENFILSNCDIMINADLHEILEMHKKNGSIFTTVTSIKNYQIPYGVVHVKNGGIIDRIQEKPEYIFQINTGVYVINKRALRYISAGKYLDMPDMIKTLIENKEKVSVYPINENDFMDMGEWEEYKRNVKMFSED